MRKFAILTSGLIFNVYCFSMALQVLTEQRIFKTLEFTKKKGTREFKLFREN